MTDLGIGREAILLSPFPLNASQDDGVVIGVFDDVP
jgi:hypothetical protein